jgi:hypothetical protein
MSHMPSPLLDGAMGASSLGRQACIFGSMEMVSMKSSCLERKPDTRSQAQLVHGLDHCTGSVFFSIGKKILRALNSGTTG